MDDASLVVYHGPDAEAVSRRWDEEVRPFELVVTSGDVDLESVVRESGGDCVVLDGSDDLLDRIEGLRSAIPTLPVVVFGGDGVAPSAAIASGVTHVLPGDADRIASLAGLAPTVERHRRERRERTMLGSLLENIPLSVYFKDGRSRYVRVSDAMLTMVGTPYLENPEGKRFHAPADVHDNCEYDLFPAGPAQAALADDRHVIEHEESIDNKIEHVYGSVFDGTYVATSKAPWYDDRGNVVGLVGVTRDVSEREQYKHRLERQNDRLERFASVVSHDLRNPLEVVRGRLELARGSDEPDEHFDAMDGALARMDALIEDVLTLAREGEAVESPESVSLAAMATDAWDSVATGGATLEVTTDGTVEADPARLRRLFENLFRNAIEHGGRADLTVTVADLHGDFGFVVTDDGVGIPADEREDIFALGFTTGDGGAGLGLNIVQTIADAHGWHVSVGESDAGGAAFTFAIPNGSAG